MQEILESQVRSLVQEDPPEEGMAPHSSILAWRISMDRGAWWATVHRVAELDAIEQLSTHACIPCTLRLLFWIFYPARVCEKRGQEHPAVTCPGSGACILTAFHWLEPRPMASCNCKRDWETYLAICTRRGNKIRWTVDIYCHRR